MDKEEIIKIIRDEVSKEFGAERIQEIEYFGPYEGEDLDVIVYVEGIDELEDTLDVSMRFFDMLYGMDLDVPFHITSAKSGMTRVLLLALIAAAVCMAGAGVGAADVVNVTLEGHFGGATRAVAVSGDYAYVGQGKDLVVLDVSSPDSPVELGRVVTLDLVRVLQSRVTTRT